MDVIWHDLQAQYLNFLFICNDMEDLLKVLGYLSCEYGLPIFGNPNQMIVYVILTMPCGFNFHA